MTPINILLIALVVVSANGEAVWNKCSRHDVKCMRASIESFFSSNSGGKLEWGVRPYDPFTYEGQTVSGLSHIKVTNLDVNLDSLPAPAKISLQLDLSSGSASATAHYTISAKHVAGKSYVVIGPETISCQGAQSNLCEAAVHLAFANVRAVTDAFPAEYFFSDLSAAKAVWNKCSKHDVKCMRASIESFISSNSGGRPEWGVRPYEPFTYEGQTVSGLSHMKVTNLDVNLDSLPAPAKISLQLNLSSGSASATADYTISTKHVAGKTYVVIGPESISCQGAQSNLCEAAVALAFANVRAVTDAFPAEYFFSDL